MTQPLLFLATLVSDPAFAGDVLLLTSWPGDLLQRQGEMVDMGVFGTIDRLDTTLSTPSLADLLAYDAVLLVNGHIPHDAEPLGKDAIGRDPHKPDPTRPDPTRPAPDPAPGVAPGSVSDHSGASSPGLRASPRRDRAAPYRTDALRPRQG